VWWLLDGHRAPPESEGLVVSDGIVDEQKLADLLGSNQEQRFEIRRQWAKRQSAQQAARRGRVRESGGPERAHVGRPSGVHNSRPRAQRSVRAAEPTPLLFALGVSAACFTALLPFVGLIAVVRWVGTQVFGGRN
jgi:hypothetical protein